MKRFKIGGVPEHFNLPWRLTIEDGDFQKNGVELHWADMSGGTGQMIKRITNRFYRHRCIINRRNNQSDFTRP